MGCYSLRLALAKGIPALHGLILTCRRFLLTGGPGTGTGIATVKQGRTNKNGEQEGHNVHASEEQHRVQGPHGG